jgi:hypothetical protein
LTGSNGFFTVRLQNPQKKHKIGKHSPVTTAPENTTTAPETHWFFFFCLSSSPLLLFLQQYQQKKESEFKCMYFLFILKI